MLAVAVFFDDFDQANYVDHIMIYICDYRYFFFTCQHLFAATHFPPGAVLSSLLEATCTTHQQTRFITSPQMQSIFFKSTPIASGNALRATAVPATAAM